MLNGGEARKKERGVGHGENECGYKERGGGGTWKSGEERGKSSYGTDAPPSAFRLAAVPMLAPHGEGASGYVTVLLRRAGVRPSRRTLATIQCTENTYHHLSTCKRGWWYKKEC